MATYKEFKNKIIGSRSDRSSQRLSNIQSRVSDVKTRLKKEKQAKELENIRSKERYDAAVSMFKPVDPLKSIDSYNKSLKPEPKLTITGYQPYQSKPITPERVGSFEPTSTMEQYVKEKPAPKESLMTKILKKSLENAERSIESREAMREGFASSATLGLSDYLPRSQEGLQRKEYLQSQYPKDVLLGEIGGYAAPGSAFSKLGLRMAGKTGLTGLGKGIAGETIAGAMMGGTEGTIKQDRPLGRALEYGALGGGFTAGLGYGGKLISKAIDPLKTASKSRSIDKAMDIYRTKGLTGETVLPTYTPKSQPIKPPQVRESIEQAGEKRPAILDYTAPQPKVEMPTTDTPLPIQREVPQPAKVVEPVSEVPTPTTQPTKKITRQNINEIKTVDQLPKTEEGLKEYVEVAKQMQDEGLDINLQLFSTAEESLKKVSKFYDNTYRKTTMFTDVEKEIIGKPSEMYDVKSEKVSLRNAQKRLNADYEGEKIKLQQKRLYSGEDIDTLMGAIEKERNIARQTGDYSKLRPLLANVRKGGTEGGRTVQSFAKYSRTPEGKLAEVQRATDIVEDGVKKSNPKIKNKIEYETNDKLNQINSIKKTQETVIDDVVNKVADDIQKSVSDVDSVVDDIVVDDIVKKASKKFKDIKAEDVGKATNFPEILSDKITKAFEPKTPKEKGFIRQMISDLFEDSKDTMKYPKQKKVDTSILRLDESIKYNKYRNEVKSRAVKILKEEFKDNPEILRRLDDYIANNNKPALNNVINKRLSSGDLTSWVKDFYKTGRYQRENFINSIMRETSLTGEDARKLKSMLDSEMQIRTNQTKYKLIEDLMRSKKSTQTKTGMDKLNEYINIGLIDNIKYRKRIGEKMSPVISQIMKDNKVSLNQWVKDFYKTGRFARENFVDAIMKDTHLTGQGAKKLRDMIESEMKSRTKGAKDKLLEDLMKIKDKTKKKTGIQKLTEYTNIGLMENRKFTNRINEKISPAIKQILKENNISLDEIVRLSAEDVKNAKSKILRDVFRNVSVDDAEVVKLIDIVNKEFNSLAQSKKTAILNRMAEPVKETVKRSNLEKLIEKVNLGLFDETTDAITKSAILEKYNIPQLNDGDIKYIFDTMDSVKGKDIYSDEYIEAMAKINKFVNEKIPATISEKISASAYTSMLANITTNVVNFGGNTFNVIPEIALNPIKRALDNLLSGEKVTGKIDFDVLGKGFYKGGRQIKRGMLSGKDIKDIKNASELYDALANPIDINPMGIKAEKFDMATRSIFDNRPARVVENLTKSAMQMGDRPFEQAFYDLSLSNLMKQKNVTTPTDEMREMASKIARDITFKGDNLVAEILNMVRKSPTVALKKLGINPEHFTGFRKVAYSSPQIVADTLLRFINTPVNIAKRILEYSPIGLAEGIGRVAIHGKQIDPVQKRKAIDVMTRGIFGSAMFGVGYQLAKQGAITGDRPKSYTAQQLAKEKGRQYNALKVGDTYIDLKRFYPLTAPLVAGASMYSDGALRSLGDYLDATGSAVDNLTELSMLQTISEAADLFKYNSQKEKSEVMLNLATQLPRQLVPSMLKKIRYWSDDYERNLADKDPVKHAFNKIAGTLPVISKMYPEKVDYKGDPVESYGGYNTLLNIMANPYKVTYEKDDPILEESLRLYNIEKSNDVLLPLAKNTKSLKVGDINYELSIEDQNRYQKILGEHIQKILNPLLKSEEYEKSSDEVKIYKFDKSIDKARDISRNKFKKWLHEQKK